MKHFLVFLLLFIGIGSVTAQNARITGTVKDNTGEAVIGANIKVKDSTGGTITDIDGHFNIEASSNATLVVSFIGYITQEVPLKGRTNVVVTLSEDSQTLDEVVVVGYGTQKKVNLTGSVAAVKVDEKIASRSITNVSSSLSGLVPGLVVSQTTGFAGGDGASLKVRGLGSINNSDPLIVVDGMPDVDINRINMNDIESISVLKDAASSAVYGSRAANGVILITTKGGSKEAKSKVTYNGSYALSSPVEFYKSLYYAFSGLYAAYKLYNAFLLPHPQFLADIRLSLVNGRNALLCHHTNLLRREVRTEQAAKLLFFVNEHISKTAVHLCVEVIIHPVYDRVQVLPYQQTLYRQFMAGNTRNAAKQLLILRGRLFSHQPYHA